MKKLPLAVATGAIGALAVGAGIAAQNTADAASAGNGPLYVTDVIQTADVHAGPLGPTADGGVGAGDLQYLISRCQQSSIRGVTGGNTFSGSWIPATGASHEEETVSEAYNAPQAQLAAKTILGWHVDNCNGDENDDLVTIGTHHHVKFAGGWSEWFPVTTKSTDGYTYTVNIAVLKVDDRVGLLGLAAKNATTADVTTVVKTAATRLR